LYENASDLVTIAAAYGYGLVTSHPFVDGNKRVGFLAMYVFLGLNGLELSAEEPEVVDLMVAVAAGRCSEEDLAVWLQNHLQ
jgi:death-on-curing protein